MNPPPIRSTAAATATLELQLKEKARRSAARRSMNEQLSVHVALQSHVPLMSGSIAAMNASLTGATEPEEEPAPPTPPAPTAPESTYDPCAAPTTVAELMGVMASMLSGLQMPPLCEELLRSAVEAEEADALKRAAAVRVQACARGHVQRQRDAADAPTEP